MINKRYVAIWFHHLITDWLIIRRPSLKTIPFVVASPVNGCIIIIATNNLAEAQGIHKGMVVADAKAFIADLMVINEIAGQADKLLKLIGDWCMRYAPIIGIQPPDGLILEVSGCPHLWGGENAYLRDIIAKLKSKGYQVKAAMADTIGTAWAISRFGEHLPVIESGRQMDALLPLPPAALRLNAEITGRLKKLGLYTINSFINMPRQALRRRFGEEILTRIDEALGYRDETFELLKPVEPYQERLPCLEPICTVTGIEIAIKLLLEKLCRRLLKEGKGLRYAILKCYRIDDRVEQVEIGTSKASNHLEHLFKLFELKISLIEPALGIELFILEASKTEDVTAQQEAIWEKNDGLNSPAIAELLDRLSIKAGVGTLRRYLPQEHFWPELSIKATSSVSEKTTTAWRTDKPRPVKLLSVPEPIEVTAPIPDYPPMLFRYKNKLHHIKKADGPERIEREWWLDSGEHRDYYYVEDEQGNRYWLFRLGHYAALRADQWFIHGFFA